jgi:dolichol kinase
MLMIGKDYSMNATIVRTIATFALLISISSPAYAYLDPATGSIIVQSVIAAVASWVMYSKIFASRAREFFGRFVRGRNKSESE